MGKKENLVREYRFTDAELYSQAGNFISSAERDQEQFTPRGYTAERLQGLTQMCADFLGIRQDVQLLGDVMVAIEARDAVAEELRVHLRSVRTMALNALGQQRAAYRAFGFAGMDGLNAEALWFRGRRVVRQATANMDDLAPEGLTPARLEAINQTLERLLQAITACEEADAGRDKVTEQRVEAGNALYREIVRLCNTGKDLWISTNEALYNDYVIYNTPAGKKEEKEGEIG